MTRNPLLASVAAAALFTAFAAHAAPLSRITQNQSNPILILASDHDHGRKDKMEGEQGSSSAANCASSEDDGDDDEGDGNCGNGATMMNQNANPPANGMIAPGSMPKAQVN